MRIQSFWQKSGGGESWIGRMVLRATIAAGAVEGKLYFEDSSGRGMWQRAQVGVAGAEGEGGGSGWEEVEVAMVERYKGR